MGEINSCSVLVAKREGKRPLGRPRREWEDNIRMEIRKIGWEVVIWLHLSLGKDQWRALVNTVTKVWVHGEFLDYLCDN
jgi:hypothetical protein